MMSDHKLTDTVDKGSDDSVRKILAKPETRRKNEVVKRNTLETCKKVSDPRRKYRRPSDIADDLFTQMCNTCEGLEGLFGGDNKYLQRATEYAESIRVGQFYCEYVINKSDFTWQLREKIERLAKNNPILLDDIICDVMFRMFIRGDRNLELIYFRDIQGRKLRWRLED
jgi:hypothetical protein